MQHPKLLLTVSLCILTLACKRPDPIRLLPTIEEPPVLPSMVRVADPATANQLLNGFYALEQNSWRWSAPKFSVVLGAPPSAIKNGASLVLKFSLPDQTIASLKRVTLSSTIGGNVLAPETYTVAGNHEYRREIPATAFTQPNVSVNFAVDKFLKTAQDDRQLGLVVLSVALEAR